MTFKIPLRDERGAARTVEHARSAEMANEVMRTMTKGEYEEE